MIETVLPRSYVCGVTWNRQAGKWKASITVDKVYINLGLFTDLDEAVMARYNFEESMDRDLYIGYSPAKRYLLKKGFIKEK